MRPWRAVHYRTLAFGFKGIAFKRIEEKESDLAVIDTSCLTQHSDQKVSWWTTTICTGLSIASYGYNQRYQQNGKRVICVEPQATRTCMSWRMRNGHLEEKSGWTWNLYNYSLRCWMRLLQTPFAWVLLLVMLFACIGRQRKYFACIRSGARKRTKTRCA